MAAALGEVGADPSIGDCACLRRELSGEPDVVNLHLRFDEGRAGRATRVAFSPTLPMTRPLNGLRRNYDDPVRIGTHPPSLGGPSQAALRHNAPAKRAGGAEC
jgi:hypothetical protein